MCIFMMLVTHVTCGGVLNKFCIFLFELAVQNYYPCIIIMCSNWPSSNKYYHYQFIGVQIWHEFCARAIIKIFSSFSSNFIWFWLTFQFNFVSRFKVYTVDAMFKHRLKFRLSNWWSVITILRFVVWVITHSIYSPGGYDFRVPP